MKRTIKDIKGFTIGATDGELGKVKEFFFDDKTWTIRYLVVETGNWLSGRKVLISPEALLSPGWDDGILPVNLTMEQIENSPDIDTEKTVSRQEEIKLNEYYPWGNYWGGGMGLSGMDISNAIPLTNLTDQGAYQPETNIVDENPHLRSTEKVTGYSIKAIDGNIGDVEDFVFDDNSWKIEYMIVDTGNWFPGKKVLISPEWITEIKWDTSTLLVNALVEEVKNSPEYDPGQEISDVYHDSLHHHYGRYIK